MREIALACLVQDRAKFAACLAGVGFAGALALVQMGLYAGFLRTSSSLIRNLGGDVWIMAKGTPVMENAEVLAVDIANVASGNSCVRATRPVLITWGRVRSGPAGSLDAVLVVGYGPSPGVLVPWSLREGLPNDVELPLRIAVDGRDLWKLNLPARPIGKPVRLGEQELYVAAVTNNIRSFTLSPVVFTSFSTAHRALDLPDGQFSYLLLDLERPDCADAVIRSVNAHPELQAMTGAEFQRKTETYWVDGSGAGAILGFSAILGLGFGAVVVAHTLYSMAREHHRELATFRALGATSTELASFVLWQAAVLAVAGGAVGLLIAIGLKQLVRGAGLELSLEPWVLVPGLGSTFVMCFLASFSGMRAVVKLSPGEVFR